MKTLAYIRVSTAAQDLASQKLAILDYARHRGLFIDEFVEVQVSTREAREKRRINEAIAGLKKGDLLIVSELSCLGRSLGQVIQIVDELVQRNIHFVTVKEAIGFAGKQDLQTKVMIALFGVIR